MASPRLVNAALLSASILVSAAFGEVVLRGFVQLPARRVLPEVKYAPHPVRRFTLRPQQEAFSYGAPARIDARGFRSNGGPAVEGGTTVLALGDSFTFGLGVRDDQTWPALLERALRAGAGSPVSVVNAGTISYGVFQELDLLRSSGLGTRPRIVIHALYWNDFMNASPPAPGSPSVVDEEGYLAWDQLGRAPGGLRGVASTAASSSALLFSMRQAAGVIRGPRNSTRGYASEYRRFLDNGLSAEDWRPVADFYEELKRLGAEHDFTPFVAIMPVKDLVPLAAPQSHPYVKGARALLERASIPFFDAFAYWEAERAGTTYFLPENADAHLNAAGYQLLAEGMSKTMLAQPELRSRLAVRH